MTFRLRLVFLVTGVTLIPFLVVAFVLYLHGMNLIREGHPPVGRFVRMKTWIADDLPKAFREGSPEASKESLPEGEGVIVVDLENRILLSTVPGFEAGESIEPKKFNRSLTEEEGFMGVVQPVVIDGQAVGVVIQRIPRPPADVASLSLRIEGSLVYLIVLVVLATLLVTVTANSMQRGIGRLERATARVASGDLDFELRPRGKDEIASLSRSFESMRQALKEEQSMRSRFLMAVSHDLKTPLTAIEGYLEAISDGMAEDPQVLRRHLAIISGRSKMLEERINELIDYVKMSTGEWRLKHQPIRLHRFLSELARIYEADAPVFRRKFECRIELPEDLELPGDLGLLTRAFDNLFHNALRYTGEGDTIRLIARLEKGDVAITFSDTGQGVTKEELERIFEPFYRGTSSRREAGTGLGLSTVRSILEAHGWSIEASSAQGQGLTFTIRARLGE
jgi:signal transduction histidine kinase